MLKYTTTQVVFREIPDEISLAINISNCPCHCEGCHSPELAEDIGDILDKEALDKLIEKNKEITCILFLGGDSDPKAISNLAEHIKKHYSFFVGWYSGKYHVSPLINIEYFDYIKLGPYIKDKGPLNNPNTNQKLFKVEHFSEYNHNFSKLFDITNKLWQ